MKIHLAIVFCILVTACEKETSPRDSKGYEVDSQQKSMLTIRDSDLEYIARKNAIIIIDTELFPGQAVDLSHDGKSHIIGICSDQNWDNLSSGGFVSLSGTDGSRMAADGRSEIRLVKPESITASFVIKNESNQSRRAIVYSINSLQERSEH